MQNLFVSLNIFLYPFSHSQSHLSLSSIITYISLSQFADFDKL